LGKELSDFFYFKQTRSYFLGPEYCAKFHQIRIKIAAVGVFTDRLTE